MGIALLTLGGAKRLTSFGLDAALIQNEASDVDSYLNTTWLLEIGRGLAICATVFLTAPAIANLFGEPEAANLIRAIGIVPAMSSVRNPGIVYFEKDLEFHRSFIYTTSSAVVQFLVGVTYALVSPTVWALVAATLSRPVTRVLLSYVLHSYRPRPSFDVEAARELVDFGKWMTGSSILYWVTRQGDDAFVGWFLSATALGFYQYAYRLADMPATEMSQIISKVTFPAYSRVQGDMAELQKALLQSTRFVAFLAFPMSFGIALLAPSFVPVVLGPQWTPMVLTMQLLAVFGLTHAITGNFSEVWKALDRPEYMMKTSVVRIALLAVVIWPATARWGIEGTALAITGVYLFPTLPYIIYLTATVTDLRSAAIYREYLYPFVASAVMFGVLRYARTRVAVSPLAELLVLVPAGAVIYASVALLLARQFNWGIEKNLRMIARGISG
jgi:PST family polysaccharide transporter/lipopolysaccharide exporter